MTQERLPHPDDLQLVAYAENRLLAFERTGIEAHLADCPTCRTLVSELAEDPAQDQRSAAPALKSVGLSAPGRGIWKVLIAAAVVVMLAQLIPWGSVVEDGPSFELAVASTRDAVFDVQRSSPEGTQEFYVGVRLQAAAWVRLVGFDQSGVALEIPLDEAGTTSADYEGSTEYIFGPYPLQLDVNQRVHTVVALVSNSRLPWPSIESTDWTLDGDEESWSQRAATLDAQVQVIRVKREN